MFTIDLLQRVITQIESLSSKRYTDAQAPFRVIADHIRGAVFMIGDGVLPSNTEQGYFVRRLLRRSVRYADVVGMPAGKLAQLAESVITTYGDYYINLTEQRELITSEIAREEDKFRVTLEKGLKQFNKL